MVCTRSHAAFSQNVMEHLCRTNMPLRSVHDISICNVPRRLPTWRGKGLCGATVAGDCFGWEHGWWASWLCHPCEKDTTTTISAGVIDCVSESVCESVCARERESDENEGIGKGERHCQCFLKTLKRYSTYFLKTLKGPSRGSCRHSFWFNS